MGFPMSESGRQKARQGHNNQALSVIGGESTVWPSTSGGEV